jgi:hypothetical protein
VASSSQTTLPSLCSVGSGSTPEAWFALRLESAPDCLFFSQVLAFSMRRARIHSLAKLAESSRALQREVLESVFYRFSVTCPVPMDSAVDAVLSRTLAAQSEGLAQLLLDSDFGHSENKVKKQETSAVPLEERYVGRWSP